MVTSLDWNDGSGDKLYLTYTASEGSQTISVTSDAHTGYASRSRDVVFQVTAGGTTITKTLTVVQLGESLTVITFNDTAPTFDDTAIAY